MRGSLSSAMQATWSEIWVPLAKRQKQPEAFFSELIRSAVVAPTEPQRPKNPGAEAYNSKGKLVDREAIQARNEYMRAQKRFAKAQLLWSDAIAGRDATTYLRSYLKAVSGEVAAINMLERAYGAFTELDNSDLMRREYLSRLDDFLNRYNIDYKIVELNVRRGEPLLLICQSMIGAARNLLIDFEIFSKSDSKIKLYYGRFEKSFHDLKLGATDERLKACLLSQFILMEAIGIRVAGLNRGNFDNVCNQIVWPHNVMKDIAKKIYAIRGDFPGVAHAGDIQKGARKLEVRDFISLTTIIAAMTPVLVPNLVTEVFDEA